MAFSDAAKLRDLIGRRVSSVQIDRFRGWLVIKFDGGEYGLRMDTEARLNQEEYMNCVYCGIEPMADGREDEYP